MFFLQEGFTYRECHGSALADVCAILDRHYLDDRATLAEKAIQKLEAIKTRTKAVEGGVK
jgi:hypothetical protein